MKKQAQKEKAESTERKTAVRGRRTRQAGPAAAGIAQRAREALISKKAENVVTMDVSGMSDVTQFYVLATGRSSPHLRALLDEVEKALDAQGAKCYRRAGTTESNWMVADFVDVVVHVFSTEMREYYAIEDLWKDARIVN